MLMMGAICLAVYVAGYASLAVGLFIIMVFASIISPAKKKEAPAPAGGVKVHGAEMLEPIIIETTRSAPFRIPSAMRVRMNPTWGAYSWWEKATIGAARMAHLGLSRVWPPKYRGPG